MAKLKQILALFLSLISLLLVCPVTVSAEKALEYDNNTYTDYTYWGSGEDKKAVPTKAVYEPKLQMSISELGFDFSNIALNQVCYDSNGWLYILEGSTGAIIVLDSSYSYKYTINEVFYNNETYDLIGAQGLYIDGDLMYICDTENARVLVCRGDKVIEVIGEPDSSIIPSDFKFKPKRFVTDEHGYGYLLSDGCYYGLMVFDKERDFLGFFGANKVKNSLSDTITELITSIFETEEKHEGTVKKLPFLLVDICISEDGYICAVNSEEKGQIKKFAPTGDNILQYSEQFQNGNGDDFNFADNPNKFVNKTDAWLNSIAQSFSAIATDSEGFIYSLDITQGRIYMYDSACNIISVFGGGRKQGSQLGTFVSPVSIATCNGDISVLDYANKNLTVFSITDYGNLIKQAQNLTLEGDYDKALEYWESVYSQDKNCQLAYIGLAKYYLNNGDYKQAMKYAEDGDDMVTYSQAYSTAMSTFMHKNLWWIVLGVIAALIILLVVVHIFKKRGKTIKLTPKINNCLKLISHPIDCFNNIKNYGLDSVPIATLILFLFYIAQISKKLFPSFMYNRVDLSEFNSIYTVLGSVGLLLLYVIVNYAVCELFGGKGTLKQIYCSSCYCLIPLIMSSFLYVFLSYIIVPSSNSGLTLITSLFTGVFVIYLLLSITVIHDVSFFKAIGLMLMVVVGIGISIFVLFAVMSLAQDLIGFVTGVIKEATLR